jgi:RNA polymerase primary sigma factor
VTAQKADVVQEGRQTPVLDLSDAAVRELVRTAKKRGYVAYDQINALLASNEVSSEQIENIRQSSARWASTWSRLKRLELRDRW